VRGSGGPSKPNFQIFPIHEEVRPYLYPAWYLTFVVLSGYLSGANTISDIAHFAELRRDWLKELPDIDRVPSYDTIWWFFVRSEPSASKALLQRWLRGLSDDFRDQLLLVDGKRLRGISDSEHITHFVELFAAKSRLTVAQEEVAEKAGEAAALHMHRKKKEKWSTVL
jgi:hypothetical protein